jgi:hypothetical protein
MKLLPVVLAVTLFAETTSAQTQRIRKTPTLNEVTRDPRDIRLRELPDSVVAVYVNALSFLKSGDGEKDDIKQCESCTSTVRLEVTSELGSVGLTATDLAGDGRLIGRIRHVDWNPFHRQKDLKLNWYGQTAYIWVAGMPDARGVFNAAVIRLDGKGNRKVIVEGRMWFCPHPGESHEAGRARWHPTNECDEPAEAKASRVPLRPAFYHLTSWFPCDQGCCVFQDSERRTGEPE